MQRLGDIGLLPASQVVTGGEQPATVRDFVAADVKATGANYWTPWLAFGDMTQAEALHSIELFARDIMPAFV